MKFRLICITLIFAINSCSHGVTHVDEEEASAANTDLGKEKNGAYQSG